MRNKIQGLKSDPLFTNSIFLMLATGIVAVFGFIFWAIVARKYDVETVGVATTLLSVSSLISLLSLAGFDTTLVRYLPKAVRKNDHINSSLIVVGIVSVVLSEFFLLLFPLVSPHLGFVSHDWMLHISFTIFNVLTAWNTLTNAVFIAYRRAFYIFLINLGFSVVKTILPLVYYKDSPMTIFVLAGLAQLLGVSFSIWVMYQLLDYTPQFKIHKDILHEVKKYSFAVYLASALNLLPPTIIPLIITHEIGPSASAYYYMAFTIASIMYTIAYSTSQSLFAEGSYTLHSFRQSMIKAAKLIALLMLPSILLILVAAPHILPVFGKEYTKAVTLLQIFTISGLAVSLYSIINTILRTRKLLKIVIIVNAVYAMSIIVGSLIFINRFGLNTVGWSWLLGTVLAILVGCVFLAKQKELARAEA